MDKEETSSSGTGSEPSISEKSVSVKRAESESPEGAESPKSEPPSKIQKQDPNLSVATKDSGISSESVKEEVSTSESPHTEDETPMEVDEEFPSDPKSEMPDKSVTSSENLVHDPTGSDPASTSDDSMKMQDPAATDDNKPSRSQSPQMDISCQSETSDATLKSKESVTLVEDTEPTLSLSLTSEVSSKPGTDKCLKKQDAIDANDEEILPSSAPETLEECSETKDSTAMEDEKLSLSLQSDISSKQSQSDEKMETLSPAYCESTDLKEKSSENLETSEEEKSTAASIPHDLSNEPGQSDENPKTQNQSSLESGMLCESGPSDESGMLSGESGMQCEPGPSGEHLKTEASTGARPKVQFSRDSFDLDRGVVGNQSLDRETCDEIQGELDPRLSNDHIVRCWNRLRDSFVRQKEKHENPEERKEQGCSNKDPDLMDEDEISIRGWLKAALPREAEYLNSIAGLDADSVPDPPPLEDDRSYSLSSGGEIPEEDRVRWRRAIALGVRLISLNLFNLDCHPSDCAPNNSYHYDIGLTSELMHLVSNLASRTDYEFPVERISLEDDSGNGSSDSPSVRYLPSVLEDDTSLGAASIRSDEEPGAVSLSMEQEVGAVLLKVEPEPGAASLRLPEELGLKCGTQSLRPIRSGPVVRLLAEGSFDSVSSESSQYPPDTDTSAYQNPSTSIDFQIPDDATSIDFQIPEDASESTSLSMTDNPKEDQVTKGLSEVHLLSEDSESVSGFEMNLEQDDSESTNYPPDDDTSSDAMCGYKKKEEKDDSDGWC